MGAKAKAWCDVESAATSNGCEHLHERHNAGCRLQAMSIQRLLAFRRRRVEPPRRLRENIEFWMDPSHYFAAIKISRFSAFGTNESMN
jgi:hypothetical protein